MSQIPPAGTSGQAAKRADGAHGVRAQFFAPPPELRRFFTTFYRIEADLPLATPVDEYLHPEWANLRFIDGAEPVAHNYKGDRLAYSSFCATGPSRHAVRFQIGPRWRMWGVGLLPLGWARYMEAPAGELVDVLADGMAHPAFAHFAPLAQSLFTGRPGPAEEYERICRFFQSLPDTPIPDEKRIVAIHGAVIDPDIDSVTTLVERLGLGQRTLERTCALYFGFAPKILLRRQRFLRSLARHVANPQAHWVDTLDDQYHDQSQFVRDFKEFMGMSPRQYALLDKPILGAVMRARTQLEGRAVQALDTPAGGGGQAPD